MGRGAALILPALKNSQQNLGFYRNLSQETIFPGQRTKGPSRTISKRHKSETEAPNTGFLPSPHSSCLLKTIATYGTLAWSCQGQRGK